MFCLILDKRIASTKEKWDSFSHFKMLKFSHGSLHIHILLLFCVFFFFFNKPTHACISWALPNKSTIQNDRNLVSGTETHLCILLGFWPCIIKSIYLLFVLFNTEYKVNILWLHVSTVVLSKSISKIAHLKHFSFEVSSILKSTFNQQIFCVFGLFSYVINKSLVQFM